MKGRIVPKGTLLEEWVNIKRGVMVAKSTLVIAIPN